MTQQPDPWSGEPFDAPPQGTSVPSGPVVPPDERPAHPGYLPSAEPTAIPPLPHGPSAAVSTWGQPPVGGQPSYGPGQSAAYPPAPGQSAAYPPGPGYPGYSPAPGYPPPPASGYSPSQSYPTGFASASSGPAGSYAPAGAALQPSGVPFMPAVVPPPPADGRWKPSRIEPVAGTEFGLIQLQVPPIASGQATGSLIAGIASILVSFLVLCFGISGASGGWGGWVAGAFTVPGVLVGAGAITLGIVSRRQIRRSGHHGKVRFTGAGRATGGIVCGAAGAGISVLALALGLLLQLS